LFLLSARPAHVLAELDMPVARPARSEAEIASLKADISQRLHEAT
jgi:ABC-type nitrate/sulfonate/bicarbonate transport system ATPase subunit